MKSNKSKRVGNKGNVSRMVECGVCGKLFTTDLPNKQYCSLVCADAAKRIKRGDWKKARDLRQSRSA